MSNAVPTVRVVGETDDGFMVINAVDFDHREHELFDEADRHLVPEGPVEEVEAEAADVADLQKQLADALDRATEAESERDEMKVRAETAEAALAKMQVEKTEV